MQKRELTGYPSIDKPWLKYYSEEAINAPLPQGTIYEYMYENNRDYPEDIAIRYFSRRITYRELFSRIDECARAFAALGVKEGEIVTVALPSIPEALYVVYALNKIGAVANMIHPLAGQKEIVNYLNEVESRVAVLFDGTYQIIKDVVRQTKLQYAVVVTAAQSLSGIKRGLYRLKMGALKLSEMPFVKWKNFIDGGKNETVPNVKKDSASMAIISHTGGTTGEPKGVMCSDRNVNAVIWQVGAALPHNRQEIIMVVLPPFINYSLINSVLEPLALGITVVLIPKYVPAEFSEYVKKYKPNHVNSIPAYWEAILNSETIYKTDCSCLKYLYYGGEGMSDETEQAVSKVLLECGAQNPLNKGFGETELVSSASLSFNDTNLSGSVGIPLSKMVFKVINPDTFVELKYNEIGEICITGPSLMLGYFKNQKATENVIKTHADHLNWLHTGDLGYINENGITFITGRIKRIMITTGPDGNSTKLFPDRIEKIIYDYPAVELCCVIGILDARRIHIPVAYVVLKNDWRQAEDPSAIIDWCRERLPDYMVPEQIIFRKELPRTDRGKVDYRALEKQTQSDG